MSLRCNTQIFRIDICYNKWFWTIVGLWSWIMERSKNLTIQIHYLLIRTAHSMLCAEMQDWLGITTTEPVKRPVAMGTIPMAVAMAREKVMETIRTNQKNNEEKNRSQFGRLHNAAKKIITMRSVSPIDSICYETVLNVLLAINFLLLYSWISTKGYSILICHLYSHGF